MTALTPWKNPRWMKKGVAMGLVHTRKVLTTDASNTGWGALYEGKPTFGHWSKTESGFHINCLEMLAVCGACQFFLLDLIGRHVLIHSDNMSVVSYINHQGGVSSKRLYTLKWSVFSSWCLNRGENPSTSELAVVLSFLQELLDKGRSHSTLKVFVAAIAAFHAPIVGQSVGRDNSVVRFLKGAMRLNPPRPLTVPTWDLPTVLRALKGPPFEPLQSTNLRSLSLKTALLLALASVKRVGDLQALSISPACLEFGPNDSKVVLKPRHGYVPKVLSTPFRAQVITLSALPPSEEDRELSLLCPVRALRIYFERSAPFRHAEQLFVSFGNRAKGHPVTKQRLSKWIVDAVMLAYSSLGLQCPIGVRAHSTRAAVFNSSPRAPPPLCTFCMFLSSLQTFVLFDRKCPAKWTSQDIPPSFQFEASVYVPFKGH